MQRVVHNLSCHQIVALVVELQEQTADTPSTAAAILSAERNVLFPLLIQLGTDIFAIKSTPTGGSRTDFPGQVVLLMFFRPSALLPMMTTITVTRLLSLLIVCNTILIANAGGEYQCVSQLTSDNL